MDENDGSLSQVSVCSEAPRPCTRGRGVGVRGRLVQKQPPHPNPSPPSTGARGFGNSLLVRNRAAGRRRKILRAQPGRAAAARLADQQFACATRPGASSSVRMVRLAHNRLIMKCFATVQESISATAAVRGTGGRFRAPAGRPAIPGPGIRRRPTPRRRSQPREEVHLHRQGWLSRNRPSIINWPRANPRAQAAKKSALCLVGGNGGALLALPAGGLQVQELGDPFAHVVRGDQLAVPPGGRPRRCWCCRRSSRRLLPCRVELSRCLGRPRPGTGACRTQPSGSAGSQFHSGGQ